MSDEFDDVENAPTPSREDGPSPTREPWSTPRVVAFEQFDRTETGMDGSVMEGTFYGPS